MIFEFIAFDMTLWNTIGETLFHSLWQGVVFWLLCGIAMYFIPKNNPNLRYWVVALSVILFFATVCQTLLLSYRSLHPIELVATESGITHYWNSVYYYYVSTSNFNEYSASLLFGLLWFIGLILMFGRFVIAAIYTYWIGYKAETIYQKDIIELKNLLVSRFAIPEEVTLKVSDKVSGIFTYGFIKPVIIWPTALLNNLSEDEVTMILAHELMHIKRQDFVMKVLLSFVNTILYYHPFIWWANRMIDAERELACDLGAIQVCSTQTQYAQTLVKLQELKLNLIATTANGFSNKNNFSNRIKRLFNMPVHNKSIKARLTIFLLLITTAGLFAYKLQKEEQSEKDVISTSEKINEVNSPNNLLIAKNLVIDTIPSNSMSRSSQVITKIEGDNTTTIKMENGKVVDIEVNGEKVDKSEYGKYTNEEKDVTIKRKWKGEGMKEWNDIQGEGEFPFGGEMPFDMELFMQDFPNHFNFRNGSGKIFGFSMDDMDKNIDSLIGSRMKSFNFNFDGNNLDSLIKSNAKIFSFGGEDGDFHFDMDSLMRGFQFNFDHLGNDDDIVIRKSPRERGRTDNNRIERNDDRVYGFMRPEKGTLTEIIEKQLKKDGLLKSGKTNKVELNNKQLKINGEKMPEVIFEKYKKLYEGETGLSMSKGNQLVLEIEHKEENNRTYKAF
jgi:bla regulator protein blaR1